MCPLGNGEAGAIERGKMDFALYRRVIDEICSCNGIKVDAVLPFWNGEALCYPEFCEAVQYAAQARKKVHGFNVFSMHTNFLEADHKTIETIIDSGIFGPITLSIDAATANVYEKIRQGGDFDRLVHNIDYFLKYRDKKGLKYPSLVFQFIVMDENKHQVDLFHDKWTKILQEYNHSAKLAFDDSDEFSDDTIYFRLLQTGDPSGQAQARNMHNNVRNKFRPQEYNVFSPGETKNEVMSLSRPPCPVLWQQLCIRYNGEASACCRDIGAEMGLGNANNKTLKELFWGIDAEDLRKAHIEGEFDRFDLCVNCLDQTAHTMNCDDIRLYISYTGEQQSLAKYETRMLETEQSPTGGSVNMIKQAYERFRETRDEQDFIILAGLMSDREKWASLLALHRHYRVKNLKVYAYLANAYQKTGDLRRSRRMYYKLARKLDPKYWTSLAFCLREQKRYFLSSFAYLYGSVKLQEPELIRNALYNIKLFMENH